GENPKLETHLIGSFCMREDPLPVITRSQPEIYLDTRFGYHSGVRCANWVYKDRKAENAITIFSIEVLCGEIGCNPSDGAKYLKTRGNNIAYSNTHPVHMTLVGIFDQIPPGQEVNLWVTAVEDGPWQQELSFPVVVRNAP
ncbi:MAG: hypothetical protein OEY44_02100, partial [Candidatus Peregrinibacteria bacterium]|nr:hypothetical protein [Candidatus Peregrinibacteria bacterium]